MALSFRGVNDFVCVWSPSEELRSLTADTGWGGAGGRCPEARQDPWDLRWKFFGGDEQGATSCWVRASAETVAIFRGFLFREASVPLWLDRLVRSSNSEDRLRALDEASGTFCGVVYDRRRERLMAFTDGYAVERIYYTQYGKGWAIGTDPFRLAALCNSWDLSPVALGGILYSGYSLGRPIFERQQMIPAGCAVFFSKTESLVSEYWRDPPVLSDWRSSVLRLSEALADFWRSPIADTAERGWLLLSGGRDSRVLLRFAVEGGRHLRLVTYERRNNPAYPFVSFSLHDTKDRETAERLAACLCLPIQVLRIPNHHVLEHLNEIVWLNHGGPLHWELHGVGMQLGEGTEPVVVGFEGDVVSTYPDLQGDSLEEQALEWMAHEGDPGVYRIAIDLLGWPIATFHDLCAQVVRQLAISRSSRRSARARWGFIRLRGSGRNVPTFQQIRRFRPAIYPYLDRRIRRAYEALPDAELRHRRAHTRLLLVDRRFSRLPVSRSPLNVAWEVRLGPLLRWASRSLMRGDRFGHRGWWRLSFAMRDAMERTWGELGGAERVWAEWVRRCGGQPGFPATAAHLIDLIRIRHAVERIRDSLMMQ